MKDLLTTEFYDETIKVLMQVVNTISGDVVGVIADRIINIGTMNASDVIRLKNIMRFTDMQKIEKAVAKQVGVGVEEIEKIFDAVAHENEMMAKILYDAKGVEQVPYVKNEILNKIVRSAIKNATKDFLWLSQTTTMGLVINGKYLPLRKAYNTAIDIASMAVNQGTTDYNSAVRKTIGDMARNGARVVYESGHTRRIDSAMRMNILDGCRQMNLSFREQQAKEYGADGWEISAHPFSRPEHQPFQGRVFSLKEFEALNESLRTPIATGEMNCRHTKVGVIMDINKRVYTDKELQMLNNNANELVTFKGLSNQETTKSRYDCTQYMRKIEAQAREYRYAKEALEHAGDAVGAKQYKRMYTDLVSEYRRISKEIGIPESINRL